MGKAKPIPNVSLAPTVAAYLAGLIDGEGCIGIYARKLSDTRRFPYHQLVVKIGMRDREAIDFMVEHTGAWGATTSCKQMSTGIIHMTTLHGRRAADFLKRIIPYMTVKKRQAELAVEFYEVCEFSKGNSSVSEQQLERRESYRRNLRLLKNA